MSAFIVEDSTINKVVAWLHFNIREVPRIARKLKAIGFDADADGWEEKLARAMFDLNVQAVNERYGEGEAAKFRPLNFASKLVPPPSTITAIKALHCWHYQCTEGEVPEDELYKLMEELDYTMLYKVVSATTEYERAAWG